VQENKFSDVKKVAIIGAGIFGCSMALVIANAGYEVVLLERLPDIMMGTSNNNTNRVHQGFHYPRDMKTAIECRDNFKRFELEFKDALLDNCHNIYGIAAENSKTSKEEFIKFCDQADLSYSVIDLNNLSAKIEGCCLGISCQESILDSDIMRDILRSKIICNRRITLSCNAEVTAIKKKSFHFELCLKSNGQTKQTFDAVINCSYANINTLTDQLGYEVTDSQYEYTAIPIISIDLPPTSNITVMDGPFMTFFPYGKTKKFLLYHVDYSVIQTEITKTLNPEWLDPHTSPLARIDQKKHFEAMIKACSKFMPALVNAKLCGFLEAPRMILPQHEKDDARPSFINDYGEGYFTIFSGKIDRSLSIADTLCVKLNNYFETNENEAN
jgi:hypothetical protein